MLLVQCDVKLKAIYINIRLCKKCALKKIIMNYVYI